MARGRKGRSWFDKDVVEEVDQPVPEGDGGEEKEMVKEFSNGPGTKSFVPQGEGRALRARKRGKILVRPSRTRRQWLTNHKLENGGK